MVLFSDIPNITLAGFSKPCISVDRCEPTTLYLQQAKPSLQTMAVLTRHSRGETPSSMPGFRSQNTKEHSQQPRDHRTGNTTPALLEI